MTLDTAAVPAAGTVVDDPEQLGSAWDTADGVGAVPLGGLLDLVGNAPDGWFPGHAVMLQIDDDGGGTLDGVLGIALDPGADRVIARTLASFFDGRSGGVDAAWAETIDAELDPRW